MGKFTRFEELDDETFFVNLVTSHFTGNDWSQVNDSVGIKPVVDEARVRFAHEAYVNNVSETRIRLHSQNPDHYKRAACLLDALNRAQVIQDILLEEVLVSELESGMAHGLSHDDCQYRLRFIGFFRENANQTLSFDLAFRCCQTYEQRDKPYTPNYLENMVHYLCEHPDQNVGSLHMIFRTYWFSN